MSILYEYEKKLSNSSILYEKLNASFIHILWKYIIDSIERNYKRKYGTRITSFGLFTFKNNSMDPIFIIDDRFTKKYFIKTITEIEDTSIKINDIKIQDIYTKTLENIQKINIFEGFIKFLGESNQQNRIEIKLSIGRVGILSLHHNLMELKSDLFKIKIKVKNKNQSTNNNKQIDQIIDTNSINNDYNILPRFLHKSNIKNNKIVDAKIKLALDKGYDLLEGKKNKEKINENKLDLDIIERQKIIQEKILFEKSNKIYTQKLLLDTLKKQVIEKNKRNNEEKKNMLLYKQNYFLSNNDYNINNKKEKENKIKKDLDMQIKIKLNNKKQEKLVCMNEEKYFLNCIKLQTENEEKEKKIKNDSLKISLMNEWSRQIIHNKYSTK